MKGRPNKKEETRMAKVNWGILGNAAIARSQMMPALTRASNAQLYAIASRSPVPDAVAPGAKRYSSYDELLDDPAVEAVYIPLPNALHCAWAVRAAEKGKNVLCEKPLAMNAKEAKIMFEAAEKAGVLLMEAFMYRYSKKVAAVLEVIQSGRIGQIRGIHAHHGYTLSWDSPARQDPSLGGGSLYDVGCYAVSGVSLMLAAQGASVEDGSASFKMVDGYDQRAAAWLQFSNGALCSVESWFDAYSDQRMLIEGETGAIEIPRFFSGAADSFSVLSSAGEERVEVPASDLFVLEVENFSKAVRGEEAFLIPKEETLKNMKTLDLLHSFRK
jgi:predicted dehydrogenase